MVTPRVIRTALIGLTLAVCGCGGNQTASDQPTSTATASSASSTANADSSTGDADNTTESSSAQPTGEPSVDDGDGTKRTSTRRDAIIQLFKDKRDGFRACYDAWSKEHPKISGSVALSIVLAPSGDLSKVEAKAIGFDAPTVVECIVAYAKSLDYPESPNGMQTEYEHQFDFKYRASAAK